MYTYVCMYMLSIGICMYFLYGICYMFMLDEYLLLLSNKYIQYIIP